MDFALDDRHSIVLNLYSDATLNLNLGMGAIFDTHWIVRKWEKTFIVNRKPSIEYLELYALVSGILTWQNAPELNNARVEIFCDNESVKYMVNDHSTNCPQCLKLVRVLTLNNIKHNRQIFVRHVRSKLNTLADAISRLNWAEFWRHAPKNVRAIPDKIPDTLWPMEKIWDAKSISDINLN